MGGIEAAINKKPAVPQDRGLVSFALQTDENGACG
jgi:hypothetical protein